MLHVLVGSNDDDYALILSAARNAQAAGGWVVPKNAGVGDPVILFTRGAGFVARGSVATTPIPGVFGKKQIHRADIKPVILLPIAVPLAYVANRVPAWGWPKYPRTYTTPQSDVAELLDIALHDFQQDLDPVQVENTGYTEGKPRQVVALRYERNPEARAACVQHYGAICAVCGFSYGEVYGPAMEGLIMVHHLDPLAAGGEKQVDPIADLRPVCADCHFVIHRRDPPYSIEEVQQMMSDAEASDTGDRDQPADQP